MLESKSYVGQTGWFIRRLGYDLFQHTSRLEIRKVNEFFLILGRQIRELRLADEENISRSLPL